MVSKKVQLQKLPSLLKMLDNFLVLFYHKQCLILGLLKKFQLKELEKKNQSICLKEEYLIVPFNALLK